MIERASQPEVLPDSPYAPVSPPESVERELHRAMLLDAGLRRVVDAVGYPKRRVRQPGFVTLLQIIVAQQLSTHVAAVIWRRLEKLCRHPVTYRKILNRNLAQLKQCGLSRQKIEYMHGLARMMAHKTLVFEDIGQLDAESAIAELCTVRGVGRWSAEIYVMFALGQHDIFPAGDLALQVAVQHYKCLKQRPSAKQTAALAESWAPHRSSVALLMWEYYHSIT